MAYPLIQLGAAVAEGVAALVMAFFTVLVFREARRIRRAESIFRQNQAWNDFGNVVADLHEGCQIGDVLMGKKVRKSQNPRQAFLLMSFFNVVNSEYNAYRAGVIDKGYFYHSLTMTYRVVEANSEWVFPFLRENGYEASFIRIVAIVITVGDDVAARARILEREIRAASCWGRGRRKRLRQDINEDKVQTYCGVPAPS